MLTPCLDSGTFKLKLQMEFEMNNNEFNIGDTVRLKSGGTIMSVQFIGSDEYDRDQIFCVWHEGRNPRQKLCNKNILVHVVPVEN